MKNHHIKYNITAKIHHWISAFVIIWATLSGFLIMLPNIDEHYKHLIAQFNVSITTILIPLFLLRIIHRVKNNAPPLPISFSKSEIKIAHIMHMLMYVLVSIVLISGLLMMEKSFVIFNLVEIARLIDDQSIIAAFKTLHDYSTRILAISIVIHILALIKHEVTGTPILNRMI